MPTSKVTCTDIVTVPCVSSHALQVFELELIIACPAGCRLLRQTGWPLLSVNANIWLEEALILLFSTLEVDSLEVVGPLKVK